jgi:hypothetical protein
MAFYPRAPKAIITPTQNAAQKHTGREIGCRHSQAPVLDFWRSQDTQAAYSCAALHGHGGTVAIAGSTQLLVVKDNAERLSLISAMRAIVDVQARQRGWRRPLPGGLGRPRTPDNCNRARNARAALSHEFLHGR